MGKRGGKDTTVMQFMRQMQEQMQAIQQVIALKTDETTAKIDKLQKSQGVQEHRRCIPASWRRLNVLEGKIGGR